tara:strand:+ start:95 stop:328 length:234 start_codon:yes stop_codon:yes gene_type:complete
MSELTLHGVESIKVETVARDDWNFTVVKIHVVSDASTGVTDFTVNLFGKPGLSIDSDEPELPFESSVVDIRDKENAA